MSRPDERVTRAPDIQIANHGSVCLARPVSVAAMEWMRDTAPEDAQFFGLAMVVEPRYVEGVVNAAREAGLEVA